MVVRMRITVSFTHGLGSRFPSFLFAILQFVVVYGMVPITQFLDFLWVGIFGSFWGPSDVVRLCDLHMTQGESGSTDLRKLSSLLSLYLSTETESRSHQHMTMDPVPLGLSFLEQCGVLLHLAPCCLSPL